MAAWLDGCRYTPTAGGTTDWTFSAAITGYNTPALAGVVNTRAYKYRAESADLSQWEIGEGTYTTATGILTRTTVLFNSSGTGTAAGQSGAGTKINFSAAPQVAIVAIKEDMISIEEANAFTTAQKDQARANLAAAGVIRNQVFSASGTYTPNANMLYCIIECWGGGGGGGGTAISGTGVGGGGGGGGAGGYSLKLASAAAIGASQTVTIGAAGTAGASGNNAGGNGGDTSVGTLCIGKGATGGAGAANTTGAYSFGGAGGVAGTGDVTGTGAPGGISMSALGSSNFGASGVGGSSSIGGGGKGNSSATSIAGIAGSGFASGGSGGHSFNTASAQAGGAGTAGFVLITEVCSK